MHHQLMRSHKRRDKFHVGIHMGLSVADLRQTGIRFSLPVLFLKYAHTLAILIHHFVHIEFSDGIP